MNKRIILFTRYPESGKCKKRLAKVISANTAAFIIRGGRRAQMPVQMVGALTTLGE